MIPEIRAAGAVVWRAVGRGAQVALIHRPKYGDWSFPKGKVDPGEHVLLTAVREVAEETGLQVNLGRPLPAVRYLTGSGARKRVQYWVGQVDGAAGLFVPGPEVDELSWVATGNAANRLTYQRDADLLGDFLAGPRATAPLILLRHASAGSKSEWAGGDERRPLDHGGHHEAGLLARLLRCFGTCQVVSSPAERCLASVRPYAELAGVPVRVESALDVSGEAGPAAGKVAAELAGAEVPVIVCAHRENLPVLIDAARARLGAADGGAEPPLRKGEFLVLHRARGRLAAAERHHPADAA